MKIILAPDSFKGSLSSLQAAAAMREGVSRVFPEAELIAFPVADGGEGTVEALVRNCGGRILHTQVLGPLGAAVDAAWGLCEIQGGTCAVIEMAQASGLTLVPAKNLDVKKASTAGTGQLMKAALDAGARIIIIGLGGSATNDGGAGMARALGAGFFDKDGRALAEGGAALLNLERVDVSGLDRRLRDARILIACDVKNPLCGPRGCAAVYGPQKGATPDDVELLDRAMKRFGEIAGRTTGVNVADKPGAGAAGGLGAGLMMFAGGQMRPGIELILEMTGFERLLEGADLVITGEGFTDSQTANGKVVAGIAACAKRHGVKVICLSGGVSSDADELYDMGLDALMGAPCAPVSLSYCMEHAAQMLCDAAQKAARLLAVGMSLKGRTS